MPIFEWNDGYSVGIDDVDQHHLHLVALLNDMYDGFTAGMGADQLAPFLDELVDYATYHFACEDRWMAASLYPELAGHRIEHEKFIAAVVALQLRMIRQERGLYLETLVFVKNWLSEHILQTDARYGRYIADGHTGEGTTIELA